MKWLCALAVFVGGVTMPARAQYHFDSWTSDSGLPQNWVKGLWQTRDGYLWVTTGQGAARFDGVRFTVFHRANTPALSSDRFAFFAMHEDRTGTLWMGTEDGGVVRYRDGIFTSLTTAQGLPGDNVVRIDEDDEGTVWIFTATGLAQWRDGELTRVAPVPGSPFNAYIEAPANAGVDGRHQGLWRMQGAEWQRFARGRWEAFPLPPHLNDPAALRIGAITEDARGRLWYTLEDRPGDVYRVENGRLIILSGFGPRQSVRYEDRFGRLWVADGHGRPALREGERLTPLAGLATPYPYQVIEDREGTIWIATHNTGLYRLKPHSVTVYLHPGGAAFNNTQPLMQDREGNIWVGSGGLARLAGGRFENFYVAGESQSPVFGLNVPTAFAEDADGTLWLGVRDGILRFRAGELAKDAEVSSRIKGLVHAIRRDRSGDLWFGSEQGLYRLRDTQVTRYGTAEGLASDDVRVLHEDRAGTLWVGTVGGLSRRAGDRFHTLTEADGVEEGRVSAIHEDAAGTVWVGTYDGVLHRLPADAPPDRVVRYSTAQGLPYDAIHTILEDDFGYLWTCGQRGIYRVSREDLDQVMGGALAAATVKRFGRDDGLVSDSCNSWAQPAGFKAGDGTLWFPTEQGVAVVDPAATPVNHAPPPVLIEACVIDRRPAACANLRLAPGERNLEIGYTALSFIKPERTRFRYRLEGLDDDWTEADERRSAYYPILPPGHYRFTVIAANSDGVWNTEGASLAIEVLPPFYRAWWFVTLVTLGAGAAGYSLYRLRVAQFARAQSAQHEFARQLIASQESERRRIAAELHDGIGQSLVIIRNWAMLGSSEVPAAAAGRQELEAISATASTAIHEVRAIAYNLGPYHLERLGLATTVQEMVDRVAQASRIDFTTDLVELDGALSREAELGLYRIAQEALNNVVKHSGATAARVTLQRDAQRVTLTVSDNGTGFHVPGGGARPTEAGFGLAGMAERVRLLHGTWIVRSAPTRGTTIEVMLPTVNRR